VCFGGGWGGGGGLGAVIIGCFVYGIQLGWGCVVSGLVCLTSSGFSSALFFSVGVFFVSGIHCVCVCMCTRVVWRIWCILEVVIHCHLLPRLLCKHSGPSLQKHWIM